jgi:hypothetical protein
MRSTRLAVLAAVAGSVLLGWSTAGVSAVAGDLSSPPSLTIQDHHHPDHDDRGW